MPKIAKATISIKVTHKDGSEESHGPYVARILKEEEVPIGNRGDRYWRTADSPESK